jgi:hypothetical protein
MSDKPTRRPSRSATEPKPPAAVMSFPSKCPNCGREPATVFPMVRARHERVEDAPLVCLECCAAVRGEQ